jgi:putative two-component system response regulator
MDDAPQKYNLLIVDDTTANLRLLSSLFSEKGYKVRSVINGQMALTAVRADPPDLILLDINMPDMNGYQVCELLKADESLADIPVIFISALDDLQDKVKAFTTGGVDYITKPFQTEEVLSRVKTHLTLRRTQNELLQARNDLLEINHHLEERVQKQVKQISSSHLATIFAMAKLAESRDSDTGRHLDRVRYLSRILTQELGKNEKYHEKIGQQFIDNVFEASALHDIGKVGIPDAILLKPGKLTAEEFEIMKTHTTIGSDPLRLVDEEFPGNALIRMGIDIVEGHHEKWDGTGYPHGLKGETIPLVARIVALVDVYDALTSVRPYKAAFTHVESREIIVKDSGAHFDPELVACFLKVEDQFATIREKIF